MNKKRPKIAVDVDKPTLQMVSTAIMDGIIEERATEFIHWWLDPNRKAAVTNWTAGWERQIGYLMEFSANQQTKKGEKR